MLTDGTVVRVHVALNVPHANPPHDKLDQSRSHSSDKPYSKLRCGCPRIAFGRSTWATSVCTRFNVATAAMLRLLGQIGEQLRILPSGRVQEQELKLPCRVGMVLATKPPRVQLKVTHAQKRRRSTASNGTLLGAHYARLSRAAHLTRWVPGSMHRKGLRSDEGQRASCADAESVHGFLSNKLADRGAENSTPVSSTAERRRSTALELQVVCLRCCIASAAAATDNYRRAKLTESHGAPVTVAFSSAKRVRREDWVPEH